jgi:hypothetical protein
MNNEMTAVTPREMQWAGNIFARPVYMFFILIPSLYNHYNWKQCRIKAIL